MAARVRFEVGFSVGATLFSNVIEHSSFSRQIT